MVVDAKAKWRAHASSSLGDEEKLQVFRTDLNAIFDKECVEKLQGDGVECAHCALCAAQATVDDMDTFLTADDASLCNTLTGDAVCASSKTEVSAKFNGGSSCLW